MLTFSRNYLNLAAENSAQERKSAVFDTGASMIPPCGQQRIMDSGPGAGKVCREVRGVEHWTSGHGP